MKSMRAPAPRARRPSRDKSDPASPNPWRWPRVIAVLVLSGGALVAAAAAAQTPWRQVPLLVLSFWLGGVLSMALVWAWTGQRPRRPERRPGRRRGPVVPEKAVTGKALEFPWTPKPVDTMAAMHSLGGGVLMFILSLVSLVSDDVRSWFLSPGAGALSQSTIGMLVFSGALIGVSLQLLDVNREEAAISVDAGGFTVRVGRSRSRILWGEVDGITTEGEFVIVESAALTRRRARLLNTVVGHRQGLDKALKLWSPQRPRATVCDMGALTVPKARLLKALRKHWGGDIVRDRSPRE